jgi:hypothetical protein
VFRLRHNPLNGVLLCSLHHQFSRTCSAHRGSIGWLLFLLDKGIYTLDDLHNLVEQSNQPPVKSTDREWLAKNKLILEEGILPVVGEA